MSVNFLEQRRKQSGIVLASSRLKTRTRVVNDPNSIVKGIRFTEGLHIKPARGDVFGLLSGTGIGKSLVSGVMAKDVLMNNDGYVVDISLEMTVDEKLDRYEVIFQDSPDLMDRLIVIDNYNEDGSQYPFSLSDVKIKVKEVQSVMGDKVNMTIIDHFHLLDNKGSDNFNPVADKLKSTAKECDTLLVCLSQTTKEKGLGDIPVPRNGCFGCSSFENICSFLMTIFQPLRRVQNECSLPVTGWQMSKIRNKKPHLDKIREEINYVLKYDGSREDLVELSQDDKLTFQMYYEKVQELRENEEKKKAYTFDLSSYVKGKNGEMIKMEKIIGRKDD